MIINPIFKLCLSLTDSIGLHRVENVSHADTAASLHVYIPAFDMCQSFDQRTGHKRKCQVTFWSKYGIRTPYVSIIYNVTGNTERIAIMESL